MAWNLLAVVGWILFAGLCAINITLVMARHKRGMTMSKKLSEPLTAAWIEEQLALCKQATEYPWHVGAKGGPSGPFHSLVTPTGRVVAALIGNTADAYAIAAARQGYPLVLTVLQIIARRWPDRYEEANSGKV